MPDVDRPRLIGVAFPLKQTSLDSVREKYGPKGHISGFHLWPARRPLAACRAALITTLLSDPGNAGARQEIFDRLAGRVVERRQKKKLPNGDVEESISEETEGGILRWGRESGPDLEWFREKIRDDYGGRRPRVLDPFAGGGAIPLEAMRLGCEATAIDINPVAWFILNCTLAYPQKLAGQTRPLPAFALSSKDFMEEYLSANGHNGSNLHAELDRIGSGQSGNSVLPGLSAPADLTAANLAWHVRAWGGWILNHARDKLARFYPVTDKKQSVAYLWARTVACKHCRANLPLLKTRWLCRRGGKRVVLTMEPNNLRTGVIFGIRPDVPVIGANSSQRREYDKQIGAGTMSRSGATCPCCGGIMTMEDVRYEARSGRLHAITTVVVVEGRNGKEYRLETEEEHVATIEAANEITRVYKDIPFGFPDEATPVGAGSGASRAFSVQGYGLMRWRDLFTSRQLLALGTFLTQIRSMPEALSTHGYPQDWIEPICAYLASALDRLVDHSSTLATWYLQGENVKHTFVRYALPIVWDFGESNTIYDGGGSWSSAISFCTAALDHALIACQNAPTPVVIQASAATFEATLPYDLIVTDPPYYDSIPYSDAMDYFYVWLRRSTYGISPTFQRFADQALSPKWNDEASDGELIDDSSRHNGDTRRSKEAYESGMFRAFQACYRALAEDGYFVVVFAHKQPDAWETLASAMIRAGFVVEASWPIQTENVTRSRARSSAALSSSVWLVCRKRPDRAGPGWDNLILGEMRDTIKIRLRNFWDAGIRGPDFVWAATGPALEAYSKHPVVKKADEPGQVLTVSEFLRHVRRIVVDFVVGRVLSPAGDEEAARGLDDVTTYYLLHRADFGLGEAPLGACILYAISCGLSDAALFNPLDLISRRGATSADDDEEPGDDTVDSEESGSGGKAKLKAWNNRTRRNLGEESTDGKPPPLIDQVHRLMSLWRAGNVVEVNAYIDRRGLGYYPVFAQLLQALIELAATGSEERSILESISNHLTGHRPATAAGAAAPQPRLFDDI